MDEERQTIDPQSVLSTKGTLRELVETLTPAILTELSDEIDEKLSRAPAHLNEYKYDPWGYHPDAARRLFLTSAVLYRYWFRVENSGIEHLPAGGDLVARVEPSTERMVRGVVGHRRRVPALRRLDLAVRRDRVAMVEIGEGAAEAAARVHLFVQEVARRVAKHRVRLGRHEAYRLAIDHDLVPFSFCSFPCAFCSFCARSMLSKSARKLP